MDSNAARIKRIRQILLRHSTALSAKQDLQVMAQKMSEMVGTPELRQLLQKSFVSGWDNLEGEIARASQMQQDPNGSGQDDLSSFGDSSDQDSDRSDKNKPQQKPKQQEQPTPAQNQNPQAKIGQDIKVEEKTCKKEDEQHQQIPAQNSSAPPKKDKKEDFNPDQLKHRPKPFANFPFMAFGPGMELPPPPPMPNPNPNPQPRPNVGVKPAAQYRPKPAPLQGSTGQPNYKGLSQKRNCLYIKNLPKHYNTAEALTNFFKKYGRIREVSSRVDKNTACISFFKEQDAVNAHANEQKVFGKMYIFKTLNPDEQPPEKLQEEIKNIEFMRKKSECEEKTKAQVKTMRQELTTKFAEKVRALLFLMNRYQGDKAELKKDFEQCKLDKSQTEALSDDQFMAFYEEKMQDKSYEWVLLISNFPQIEDRKAISEIFDVRVQATQKHGKNTVSTKDGELRIKYLALDSIPKILADPAVASLELRFSNMKMHNYIDHIRKATVCKLFMIYIGLRIELSLISCSSVGSLFLYD